VEYGREFTSDGKPTCSALRRDDGGNDDDDDDDASKLRYEARKDMRDSSL
jgi:hypothetical protein